ncbi:hypothetical protein C7974DRAFT_385038 [Boeremia exigua]|uniref:uncharacterized protein n=1 Tax=Boeremia exigua TaxID=749465 RepID=UPI001E8E5B12|nr:uncharacterized protein C7974DRAFT_385038 [Boeremia exigua]KAH6642211.1 hypothetical protein C7974DRAFT_385038 [Boeremia exigua]
MRIVGIYRFGEKFTILCIVVLSTRSGVSVSITSPLGIPVVASESTTASVTGLLTRERGVGICIWRKMSCEMDASMLHV